ncbi:MAG: YicC family protein [Candidatus Dadabacteria bacterium]|nr:YicC family protein [Candidatus Dadabacteria bacterium]
MKSMTGFGKSSAITGYGKVAVEARSENHRYLDVKLQLPDALSAIEPELSETVRKLLHRGKVRVTVSLEGMQNGAPSLNIELAKQFGKSFERLRKELGIKEDIRLDHFLALREIFAPQQRTKPDAKDVKAIEGALVGAVKKLDAARVSEGKKLEKDLIRRIGKIERLTKTIGKKRKGFMKAASEKLKERISKALEDVQIDEGKLYQEAAFLTERSDITEELVRLNAHTAKFRQTIKDGGSIGRELDFLLQEMNREAGTISAKAKDAEVSHITIDLRSELEKIREQIQNIE